MACEKGATTVFTAKREGGGVEISDSWRNPSTAIDRVRGMGVADKDKISTSARRDLKCSF